MASTGKVPSVAEPVTALRRVRIVENGEPLVDFLKECPDLRQDLPRFNYRRETLIRRTMAAKLCEANSYLMARARRIQIIEGWRPPHIQRRMYRTSWERFQKLHPDWSETKMRRHVNQFTAPMSSRVPPPHTTGGAVDVALTDLDGRAMEMMSPYAKRDWRGFFTEAPGLSDGAKANRELLVEAMIFAGLTNYPSEYWHWSYGDQGWAYRGGHEFALYGAVTPDDWTPSAEDAVDAPLSWIYDTPQ